MTRNGATAAQSSTSIEAARTPARPSVARLATNETAPVASHVHDLQLLLTQRLEGAPAATWSPRATLGFIVLVCGGFWLGVALAIHLLVR